jgi:carbonic anhydrase/acetyltransferase-like protein (isoleucine patch superfamily)
MGAKIIDYSIVESEAMVAAGSLLSPKKIVKKGELWAGIPARFFRKMTEEEIKYIWTSKDNYVKLSSEYQNSSSK